MQIAYAGTITGHRINCGACKDVHGSVAEVAECYAWQAEAEQVAAEQAAECWAENYSSARASGLGDWDARTYANVLATGKTWGEHLAERDAEMAAEIEAAGTCHHGLSKALCQDPDGDNHWGSYLDDQTWG
jgi:hypothetical protein